MKIWYGVLVIALMLSAACGGAAEPEVDIEATVETRLKERLTAIPTPTARVVEIEVVKEVVVEKEVIVEKIVVVTATPTPMPTAMPTPMPTATPLDAFDGTIHITSQTGVMVHEVKWSLINNSKQDVTLVKGAIHNDSGRIVGAMVFLGEPLLAAGRDKNVTTHYMNATEEQVMTYPSLFGRFVCTQVKL